MNGQVGCGGGETKCSELEVRGPSLWPPLDQFIMAKILIQGDVDDGLRLWLDGTKLTMSGIGQTI